MRLSELKTGERGVIVKVNGHGSFRKRIIEMGFVKGNKVKVILNAPLRDPIEYEIIGYKISLRREEAAKIEVISETEAKEFLSAREALPALDAGGEAYLEREMTSLAEERRKVIRVALVGNPNCGKTSLFNIASGSHEHVGNYSGVTVDAKEGTFEHRGYKFILVDLPGTYSLSAYSPEELYVRRNLIDEMPDVVVNVVDASNLQRNLYLTTQLIDMNLRVVMALNMYDELNAKGDVLDIKQLGYLLGIPVVPTVSRSGQGIDELFDTVIQIYEKSDPHLARHIHINHGAELEHGIDRIKLLLQKNTDIRYRYSTRYLAIKYLENDKEVDKVVEALPNRDEIISARFDEQKRIETLLKSGLESAMVDAKYAFVQGALAETYTPYQGKRRRHTLTDKIDSVVTNRWLAFPIFIALLYLVFEGTFVIGEYPMGWIEWVVDKFGAFVASTMKAGWLKDLVVDGIIGGVGSVLVFLPNILILYLFISLLEDSGYMARAAFIMDRLMHKIGLHGKSFIPMIMGFGCNVPAVMATRTIESHKSRLITMLVIPLMSCAGRMPVYILIAGAFFPRHAGLVLLGMYALGIVLAMLAAKIMSVFFKDDDLPFVMELPPYRIPTGKSILRHTWEKGRQYLQKMSGIILICSIVIWFLGYFPAHDAYDTVKEQQEHSFIGYIGKSMEPVLEPLGFDWRMGVGIVAGVGAKELVVSTLGVMYADEQPIADLSDSSSFIPGEVEEATAAETRLQKALVRSVTPAGALAYMVFILLYFPCIATFVAIKNESGGWKWAIVTAVYTIALAWVAAFITFRIASLFI
ncbi:MAG: ferrous iron transport protein B [Bacteroidales bacterium]|nr:ferrous iron transport protein B [Bacteroidales bacterium]MBQ7772415.1 ferrous iron transport protein B [Bacteroidales bacterium]MBQ8812543.1 ferrous iron transport protein B [Bacteroidales bacterium]